MTGQSRAGLRDGLPHFIPAHDVDKFQARKSGLQEIDIPPPRAAKVISLPQAGEETLQVPPHDFETKNLVRGRGGLNDAANVSGEIPPFAEPVFGAVLRLEFGQEELLGPTSAAGGMKSIRE